MAPFAGDAMPPFDDALPDRDAAAHAGAEDRAEHHARAARGAVARFGQREAVGVVRETHFLPRFFSRSLFEKLLVVRGVIGVLDQRRFPDR